MVFCVYKTVAMNSYLICWKIQNIIHK